MSGPRLMLVRVALHESGVGPRKQRWIADDFRAGMHRTRRAALYAWRCRQAMLARNRR